MKIKKTTLKNGLRVVTVPMKDSPTVTVLVMVAAGTRYETRETNGLSHFLEHMCFKGTKKRTALEIAYQLEAIGAQTNAFTWYDYTGYYAKGRSGIFSKLLDIVSDVYLNSIFPEQEINKERGVICGEIDMYEDIPQRKVHDLFTASIYGNQPAGYTVLGPKENIQRFTKKDFDKYHKQHYVAGKTIVVVAGNIPKTTEQEIKKAFKNISVGTILKKKKVTKVIGKNISVQYKKTDQTHIIIGIRSLTLGHPDYVPFSVMIALLGQGMSSRLFIKLREEMGSGYYVSASNNSSDDSGDITISTGTQPARVPEVLHALFDQVKAITVELVNSAELQKTKEYLIGQLYMGMELSDDVAHWVAHYEVLNRPQKTLAQLEKEIRAVTSADIMRVAKRYLKLEQFHIAIIGPHTESEIKKVI